MAGRWIAAAIAMLLALGAAPGPAAPPPPLSDFRDCRDGRCPEMVVLPLGAFDMGASAADEAAAGLDPVQAAREEPRHHVAIARSFAIGRNEVTVGEWRRFVTDSGRADPADCTTHDAETDRWIPRAGVNWRRPGFAQTENDPAICLSWDDAEAYVAWLSRVTGQPYRLPSEAEWEYAARGGTTTVRYWGDAAEPACDHANIMSTGMFAALGSPASWHGRLLCAVDRRYTMPVGRFAPNPFGLHDMYGNALEWIEDCYHPDYAGAPADGSAWRDIGCQAHFLRGGAFDAKPSATRSAARGFPLKNDFRAIVSGFRVVRDFR